MQHPQQRADVRAFSNPLASVADRDQTTATEVQQPAPNSKPATIETMLQLLHLFRLRKLGLPGMTHPAPLRLFVLPAIAIDPMWCTLSIQS